LTIQISQANLQPWAKPHWAG